MNYFLRCISLFLGLTALLVGHSFTATATATKDASEYPVFGCYRIITTKVGPSTVMVESNAYALNGAFLVDRTYHLGDGTVITTNETGGASVIHRYSEQGDYSVAVVFRFNVDGIIRTVYDSGCESTITIAPPRCDSLTAVKLDSATYRFSATITATDGATVVSYTYNFGDGKMVTTTQANVSHTYSQPGSYSVTVTVNVKTVVDGKIIAISSSSCTAPIKVEAPPSVAIVPHDLR